jgi:hypothetical protein
MDPPAAAVNNWGKIEPLVLNSIRKTVGVIGIAHLSTAYEVDDGGIF